jgi:hypothetical protein
MHLPFILVANHQITQQPRVFVRVPEADPVLAAEIVSTSNYFKPVRPA